MGKESAIKNILAVRTDRFGEFLLNIPALRALKKRFPEARLILICASEVAELARLIPFADEIIAWENKKKGLIEKIRLVCLLRSKKIDCSVILNPTKEFNLICFFSAIRLRLGYDRKWGFLLNRKIKDEKHLGHKHEIEYNLELVRLIGADTADRSLSLNLNDDLIKELFAAAELSMENNLVAIHPWTSDPIKQWPLENFRKLAQRLSKESNLQTLIIGGGSQLQESRKFCAGLGSGVVNLTGKTNLPQLAVLLKRCKLLISGDSGPVHLASCAGTPALTIFKNGLPGKSPTRWGPLSKGSIVIKKMRLCDITVDEVFNRAKEALEDKK